MSDGDKTERRRRRRSERRVRFSVNLSNEAVDLSPGEGLTLIAGWDPASW